MDDQSKNYFTKLAGATPSSADEELSAPSSPEAEVDLVSAEPLVSPIKTEHLPVKSAEPKSSRHSRKSKSSSSAVAVNNDSDDLMSEDFLGEAEGQLTVDVFQTPEEIVIQSTIAGVKPEDLTVDITGESVSIRGRREREEVISDNDYFYQECYWGRFSRSIILPQEINPDKSTASLRDGVLTIRLPKLERERNKKLRVKIT